MKFKKNRVILRNDSRIFDIQSRKQSTCRKIAYVRNGILTFGDLKEGHNSGWHDMSCEFQKDLSIHTSLPLINPLIYTYYHIL